MPLETVKPEAMRFALKSSPKRYSDPTGLAALRSIVPIQNHDHARFHYGRPSQVIEDFTLTVHPGEKIGLVGLNGTGKSTLRLLERLC